MRRLVTRAARGASGAANSLRDRILVALSDRAAFLQIVESTHRASGWAASAHGASRSEIEQGLGLIDGERARLESRLAQQRERRERLAGGAARASSEAEIERLLCRLQELVDHRAHLVTLLERLRPEVEVESIEWQHPLVLPDGSVAGFVDLWATVRATSYRVAQSVDPWDPEGRSRYEGNSLHYLVRTVAVTVEPDVVSLVELVRRVRYVQALAKNALPLVITCTPFATDVLASQGIPVYSWTHGGVGAATSPALPSGVRRPRRARPAPPAGTRVAQPQLPSPRASLPPAPLG